METIDAKSREFGLRLIQGLNCPKLRKTIYRHGCWDEVMDAAKPLRDKLLPRLQTIEIPSAWAFYWVLRIGDRELMRDRITGSKYAYWWGVCIGDRDCMRDRVTESNYAFYWAVEIGDREIMRDRVIDSRYAYFWICDIGDRDIMRERITDPYWIEKFNELQ